jgi:hypothetical protein
MELRFNDPDEFVAELRHGPPNAELMLRLTVRRRLDAQTGAFAHVSVLATFLRRLPDGPPPTVLVVALEAYQGEDWGPGFEQTRTTLDRAERLLGRLRTEARVMGLEYRPGMYES